MPVSRVPGVGNSNCQLSNDARISQKMPVSLKNIAEPDHIISESIALRIEDVAVLLQIWLLRMVLY